MLLIFASNAQNFLCLFYVAIVDLSEDYLKMMINNKQKLLTSKQNWFCFALIFNKI